MGRSVPDPSLHDDGGGGGMSPEEHGGTPPGVSALLFGISAG